MPGDKRLFVRPSYVSPVEPSQVWQVVDGATVVGTHASREDAAKQVLKSGARIALTWERSKMAGREGAHDYSAQFTFRDVGRIHKTLDADGTTYWARSMNAMLDRKHRMGTGQGRCDDRLAAAIEVERAFTELLATPDS